GVSNRKPRAARGSGTQQGTGPGSEPMTQSDTMAQQRSAPAPAPAQNFQSAPPPRPPANITIPDGTVLSIRMLDTLNSETANPGDAFRATLNSSIEVDGKVVIPADADINGRVIDAHAAGKFKGAGLLTIELVKVSFNGRSYPIYTDRWSKETSGRGKNTAEKVGGGAALGAIIGALAGGGKGAGVGTVV